MSAEGKKKRGLSGVANAKDQPFRRGGRPCNYSTSHGRTERTNARWEHTVNFSLGVIHEKLGFTAPLTARLTQLYDARR